MNANMSGSSVTGLTQMAGMGSKGGSIPFFIQGTTSDPKFVPDVKGMAGGLLQGVLGGKGAAGDQKNSLGDALGGLFGKKKPQK